MKLLTYWIACALPMLAMADEYPQVFKTLKLYRRASPARQRPIPSPMQRAQTSSPRARSGSITAQGSHSSAGGVGTAAGRISPGGSVSSSRASSGSLESGLASPTVQGIVEPPFTARYIKDGHQAPLAQFLTGSPKRQLVIGQKQASISVETMRHEPTNTGGRAALLAKGHDLASVSINTHDGGTGFIEPEPLTRPGHGRYVPPGGLDSIRVDRQHPMRELSAGVQLYGPGEITAEAKNPDSRASQGNGRTLKK